MNTLSFIQQLFTGSTIAILGTTLTVALSGWGSAKAIGSVGSVVAGSMTEDPNRFGKLLILEALPGTQGIYGLIVWFLFMVFAGYVNGNPQDLTVAQGLMIFGACLPTMIVGYFSAIHQGKVAASGCSLVSKRPDQQVKAIAIAAMVETYAIFAVLVSILTMIWVLR